MPCVIYFSKIRSTNPSSQRLWPTLPVCRVWGVPAANWHSENFRFPLPSLFKWVGWAVCADFQVCNGVISWRSRKLHTAADSEFPLILQKHTTSYNRLILRQAILTARTSYLIVSGYTLYCISRGQPARQNEVQSWQVCKIQGDSCRRLFSHVTTYRDRSGKLVLSYSKHLLLPIKSSWTMDGIGGDLLTMYFKTPLALLWLNPAVSKLHLINLLKELLLPVPEAVYTPHEESESVESPSTPTPPTPAPRRSKRATKPPQRLIEEVD